MDQEKNNTTYPFLAKGGEMGALMRSRDWSKTPIGNPEDWPQSLRTTLSILLNSRFPMFLWWGPDLICFYNDAYRPSLGENGKHPTILGQPAKEAWAEIWDIIKPLMDQVLAGGDAIWSEDQLIPIFRNGKIEDVYWTFSYSPVNDESNKIAGILVTCHETTQRVKTLSDIKEREDQLSFTINAAELATWDLDPATNRFVGNDRLKEWFGLETSEQIELPVALNRISERDRKRVSDTIQSVLQPGSNGNYEIEYSIRHPITEMERRVVAKGKVLFNQDNIAVRFSGILEDVTEQVSAKNALLESELRFQKVANSAPVLLWMSGTDKSFFFFNQAWLLFTGKTLEQEYGNGWTQGVHPEDLARLQNIYAGAFDERKEFDMEYRLRRADGEYRWVSDHGVPRFTETGVFEGYIGACMDIHEKIVHQNKKRETEERLNVVIKASELGTWELDLNTDEVQYSDRYLEIFGYKDGVKLEHAMLITHLHPDDISIRHIAMQQALETGVLYFQSRLVWNDKSIHWIEVKGSLSYDKENKPAKLIGTIGDITNEKLQQEVLSKSEEKFRLLADSMPQHIWTADIEGNLNYFNRSVFEYSGLSMEKITKDGWLQIVHPEDREGNIKEWIASVTTGRNFLFEHRFRRHDGEYRWQLSRAIPQRDANGKIQMWVGTSTDIEDQKTFAHELEKQVQERTAELEQKNKELEKMNAELQSFAYISSHDLQEPLRKIQTFATRIEAKENENLSASGKDYFRRMQQAANRMQTLIEDLLAYSRTDTTERVFKRVDLTEIIQDVTSDIKERLDEKQGTIEVGKMCSANIIPFQFRQLMFNLISNSLKFSLPEKPPHIKIQSHIAKGEDLNVDSLTPKNMYCHVSVSDNGIGFEPQYRERIFELFQRLHGNTEFSGTGIGLAIVKKIVDNHNGVITATSELNKGATFDIYIPAG